MIRSWSSRLQRSTLPNTSSLTHLHGQVAASPLPAYRYMLNSCVHARGQIEHSGRSSQNKMLDICKNLSKVWALTGCFRSLFPGRLVSGSC